MEDARRVEEGFGHAPLEKKDHNEAYFSEKLDGTDSGDRIENEKDDRKAVLNQPTEQNVEEQPLVKPKSKRVATLDAFRGLTIVVRLHTHTYIYIYIYTHTYYRTISSTTFLTTINIICYDSFLIKVVVMHHSHDHVNCS